MEMDTESHGGVSIMMRLTQHRNYEPIIVALVESYSPHPLAEHAQAYGSLTQMEGPGGLTAPVVTTGSYKKKLTRC